MCRPYMAVAHDVVALFQASGENLPFCLEHDETQQVKLRFCMLLAQEADNTPTSSSGPYRSHGSLQVSLPTSTPP